MLPPPCSYCYLDNRLKFTHFALLDHKKHPKNEGGSLTFGVLFL